MDEWYIVWQVDNGSINRIAAFLYRDDAADYLKMTIDSGYISHQGRIAERKNVEGLEDD